jgi:Protein of unknown function (DUF2953).
MLVIALLLLVFLFILFILFTAIGLTFKFNVLSLDEKKELRGILTVKWLLFSRTFSVEEPGEEEILPEEPEISKKNRTIKEEQSKISLEETEKVRVTTETKDKAEVRRKVETEEIRPNEQKIEINEDKSKDSEVNENRGLRKKVNKDTEKRIEVNGNREKKGIIARIRRQNKPKIQESPEEGMTTKEILNWVLKAFRYLRRPFFRLLSDLLNGIKIKRLESYITFGLSDPADTGILCGFIYAAAGLVYSRCRHCSFSINPVFINPMVDFRGNMEISVRIYSMIFPMLKFMFNRKTLSFTYLIIKEKLWGERKFNS